MNEFAIYRVSFVMTCSYRVVTRGLNLSVLVYVTLDKNHQTIYSTVHTTLYVVGSKWQKHERDEPFTVRANCRPSGVCVGVFMFKQSGEFCQLTPRLGCNELWFVISDLVRPGNDVRYIRNLL